jgi:hypothetical protein
MKNRVKVTKDSSFTDSWNSNFLEEMWRCYCASRTEGEEVGEGE